MSFKTISISKDDVIALQQRYEQALDANERDFKFVFPSTQQEIELAIAYCYYLLQYLEDRFQIKSLPQLREPPTSDEDGEISLA